MNKESFYRLITMLREIDLYKNSPEQVREVLNFIAEELEKLMEE